jgi:hypothetical protein
VGDEAVRVPMPDTKWSTGSARITSKTLSPGEITDRLGISPDAQFEKGSLASPRNPNSRRRDINVWIRRSGLGDDRWLEEHVAALVGVFGRAHEELSQLAVDCDLELFLGFGSENGQGGCALSAQLLMQVAELGFDVILDLYPPTPADVSNDPQR